MEPQAGELQHGFVEAGKDKMRSHIALMSTAELALIAALSGIGTYAFVNSDTYSVVREFGAVHNYAVIYYVPAILWGLLFTFGVFNISFRGKGNGFFAWVVTLLSLPSLLSYDTINLLGIFGSEFQLSTDIIVNSLGILLGIFGSAFQFSTNIGFSGMLALGVLIITGYVVLNYLHLFKQARHNLTVRGASSTDIKSVVVNSHLMLLLSIVAALAATIFVAFLSRNLELLVLNYIRKMPWNVVCIGLFCIMLLAFYLYWLGARRRTKNQ